jgi:hypothetical protein
MNKRIDFTKLEGINFTQDLLDFLQSSYRDAIGAIAQSYGPLVIVSGVDDLGTDWGNGWMCINGELLPFVGGTKAARVIIQEAIAAEEFGDGNSKNVYFTRTANLAGSGGNAFADFVRVDGIAKSTQRKYDTIQFIIDGGGAAITTGQKGHIEVPFNCVVKGWTIFSNASGSIVVDIWKDTYANFPPTNADTITGSQKPTLSSAVKNQNTDPNTWTAALNKGDILAFNVDSATTVQRVTIVLQVEKN